jgi:hypothetical protein
MAVPAKAEDLPESDRQYLSDAYKRQVRVWGE